MVRVRSYNGCEAACELTVKAAPTGVKFQEGSVTLYAGDSRALLPPVISGADAASGRLTYKSSSTKYVKVSAGGTVTGVKAGKAKLTVSTYNGKKASIWVYVKSAPKAIAFAEGALRLLVDQTCAPELKLSGSVSLNYTLSSSNEQVARILNGRTIQAVGGGSATITATAFNGKTASLQLTVPALPDSVALKPAALTLGAGDGAQLTAAMPSGQDSALRFESSDPAVASVDASGAVRALRPGSATIRVYTQNGLQSASSIAVIEAPTRVTISPQRAMRNLDEGSLQLRARFGSEAEGGRLSFASSDPAVATVSADGLVRFVAAGTVRITVQTYNGCTDSCVITIGEQPGEMRFDQASYAVALGDGLELSASFDRGCESYALASDNPAVVAIVDGEVRGLALGRATISAVSRSGLVASCAVEVVPPPTGIALEPLAAKMVVGINSTLQLKAAVLPGGVGGVYYTSSAPGIASVDSSSGLVVARSAGTCAIRATTYDGMHSAECTVEVGRLLDGVKIGIDPGHQTKGDPSKESSSPKGGSSKPKVSDGATGRSTKVKEHVTNLQVGLKLRDALEALGAEVYMTRETADVNISNKQRAQMMNAHGVDLVLRLHCNSTSSSGTKGIELYIRKSCAYDSSVVDGKALLAAESRLAKALLAEMPKATGAKGRKIVKNNDYTGNNWSTVPCVLVEMGYNSNPAEDKLLNSPAYQDKLVRGMINGVCVYLGRELPTE